MVELRTLHFTDLHEDYDKISVIGEFLKKRKEQGSSIDAIFFTGDFIDAHSKDIRDHNKDVDKTIDLIIANIQQFVNHPDYVNTQKAIQKIVKEHSDANGKVELDKIPKSEIDNIAHFEQTKVQILNSIVQKHINAAYQKMAEEFAKLKQHTPIYSVLGNHDLKHAYEHLDEVVDFLDRVDYNEKSVTINGKNGVQFRLKGDQNTFEFPKCYSYDEIRPFLKPHFIDYDLGNNSKNQEKEIKLLESYQTNDSVIDNLNDESKKVLKKLKEEGRLNDVIISKREALTQLINKKGQERSRLSLPDEVDIYLTHKLHLNNGYGGSSEITQEYSANASGVHGGHFHALQIGGYNLEELMEIFEGDENKEYTVVDGKEIPVVYIDDDRLRYLNPGTQHFLVTDYNSDKKIKEVVVYDFN